MDKLGYNKNQVDLIKKCYNDHYNNALVRSNILDP